MAEHRSQLGKACGRSAGSAGRHACFRRVIKPEPDDLVVLYSDSASESVNSAGIELGRDGLMSLAEGATAQSAAICGRIAIAGVLSRRRCTPTIRRSSSCGLCEEPRVLLATVSIGNMPRDAAHERLVIRFDLVRVGACGNVSWRYPVVSTNQRSRQSSRLRWCAHVPWPAAGQIWRSLSARRCNVVDWNRALHVAKLPNVVRRTVNRRPAERRIADGL